MNADHQFDDRDGRRHWEHWQAVDRLRRVHVGEPGAAGGPALELIDLAVYAERANDLPLDERRRIEARLAADPSWRAALTDLMLDDDESLSLPSEDLRRRLVALVPKVRTTPRPVPRTWIPDLSPFLRRVGGLAAAIVVAVAGWKLGEHTVNTPSLLPESPNDRLAGELTFGLFGSADDFVLDELVIASLETES